MNIFWFLWVYWIRELENLKAYVNYDIHEDFLIGVCMLLLFFCFLEDFLFGWLYDNFK